MNNRSRTVIGLIATAALILAACGGGDDAPKARPTPPLPSPTKDELARSKQGAGSTANKDIIGTPAVAKLTPETADKPAKAAPAKPAPAPKATANPGQMLVPDATDEAPPETPTPRPRPTPYPTRTGQPAAAPAGASAPQPTRTPVPTR